MGDRAHLAAPDVGVHAHVDDVVAVLEWRTFATSSCVLIATAASP
jgi:hypothetical protein